MYTFEVRTKFMGTFYVPADDYSTSPDKTRVLFWTGKRITRSFQLSDLETGDTGSISRVYKNPNMENSR